jgi:bifunctional non-homologous end joining protein LigD
MARIPAGKNAVLAIDGREVALTNLDKPFWPELGLVKRDLLQYYADVAPALLPHIRDRPMVMRRYPDGAFGGHFFMKRAPAVRPDWIQTCTVEGIDYPLIQDLAALLWVTNLGCIDLNPFHSRCDDVRRPDWVCFDLDPGAASFAQTRATAVVIRDALVELGLRPLVKTSGGAGLHVYAPIVRGPTQHQVWAFAKALAVLLAGRHPALMTAEHRIASRPAGRVLVDYNQDAWGRTLAAIYSVRPTRTASVSTPLTWRELERGARIDDFRIDNVPARVRRRGDLWAELLAAEGRFDLSRLAGSVTVTARRVRPRSPTARSRTGRTARRGARARRRGRTR